MWLSFHWAVKIAWNMVKFASCTTFTAYFSCVTAFASENRHFSNINGTGRWIVAKIRNTHGRGSLANKLSLDYDSRYQHDIWIEFLISSNCQAFVARSSPKISANDWILSISYELRSSGWKLKNEKLIEGVSALRSSFKILQHFLSVFKYK